jgi:hypothetical protein
VHAPFAPPIDEPDGFEHTKMSGDGRRRDAKRFGESSKLISAVENAVRVIAGALNLPRLDALFDEVRPSAMRRQRPGWGRLSPG